MLGFESGLYVTIVENISGPAPFPLKSGFSSSMEYRVLGIYNASETSEAYLIMCNDRNELWFISNRHTRFSCVNKDSLSPSHLLSPAVSRTAAMREASTSN